MLVFAAFVPHPITSVPDVSPGSGTALRRTVRAYRELADELYAAQPATIVMISAHAPGSQHGFTINQRPQLSVSFAKMGNLSDRLSLSNDLALGYRIKESLETGDTPVFLTDDTPLDYATGVALFHLLGKLRPDRVRVVPIGTSTALLDQHYQFGRAIGRHIQISTDRIAVIATGDLSHGTNRNSVTGYNPKALAFNNRIKKAVEKNDVRDVLSVQAAELAEVRECAVRPLGVLYGCIGDRRYTPRIMSYEVAQSVGYLTAAIDLS